MDLENLNQEGDAENETTNLSEESGESGGEDFSDVELEAMQHGWNPEGVEGKRNLSAEEFMDRKQLYDDLRSVKKRNKRLEEKFNALQAHHQKVSEREREKLISELKQAKAAAMQAEDYNTVTEIDDQLIKARSIPAEEAPSGPTQAEVDAQFREWKTQNGWYDTDPEMRQFADMIGNGYFNTNNGPDLEEVWQYVAKEVRQRFPDKFEAPKPRANIVAPASKGRNTKPTSKQSFRDLPEDAREIGRTLVRSGVMTEEQYLKEYFG